MLLKDAVTGTNTAEVKRSKYDVVNINYKKKKAFEKIWLMKGSQNDKTFQ